MSGIRHEYQTPESTARRMVALIDDSVPHNVILEPTPGHGNIVRAIIARFPTATIHTPDDYWTYPHEHKYDIIVANPPFIPCKDGYRYLFSFLEKSDHVIILMPWVTLINSTKRLNFLQEYGLKAIHHLSRNTFPGIRPQTFVMELIKGFHGKIVFDFWEFGTERLASPGRVPGCGTPDCPLDAPAPEKKTVLCFEGEEHELKPAPARAERCSVCGGTRENRNCVRCKGYPETNECVTCTDAWHDGKEG